MMNVFKFLILFISFSVIVHAQAEIKFDVRVVDVKSLVATHPDAVVINKIIENREKLRSENDEKLKRIREIATKMEHLYKQIDDPNIRDDDKEKLIRDRHVLANEANLLERSRLDYIWKRGSGLGDYRELRNLRQKIKKQISVALTGLELDLVIDKSARGLSGGLLVVYSAKNLDLTEMIRGKVYNIDKNAMTKDEIKGLGLPYEKLKIATVKMGRLYEERRKGVKEEMKVTVEVVAKRVENYAKQKGIHLVLDSSSESNQYSQVLTVMKTEADITDNLLKNVNAQTK